MANLSRSTEPNKATTVLHHPFQASNRRTLSSNHHTLSSSRNSRSHTRSRHTNSPRMDHNLPIPRNLVDMDMFVMFASNFTVEL